jgi:hypothetical protein
MLLGRIQHHLYRSANPHAKSRSLGNDDFHFKAS